MPTYAHNFADLKRQATFEAVCAHYNLALIGHGAQRSALCPFHNDTKPSLKIHLDKKIFHCFGCDAKGNILDFVRRMEHGFQYRRGGRGARADLRHASGQRHRCSETPAR